MSKLKISRVSSLVKIRQNSDICLDEQPIYVFAGEHYSFQIAIETQGSLELSAKVTSTIDPYINIYVVKDVIMDYPINPGRSDNDYITKEPGFMPDLLIPLEKQHYSIKANRQPVVLWVDICVPRGHPSGEYALNFVFSGQYKDEPIYAHAEPVFDTLSSTVKVLSMELSPQSTEYTQWFHVDCIASAHNVPVYSEAHWTLIDKYIALAADLGITMLLTPVFTPSMDIKEGCERTNVQLVRIEVTDKGYKFDFSLLRRWLSICIRHGINTYEIVPLFTQWGLKYSPVIKAERDGKEYNLFGWHIKGTDSRYANFLQVFIPELLGVLRNEGVLEHCRFHISDEPYPEHLNSYRYAYNIIRPLLEGCEIIDTLSQYEFYEEGLVDIPVTPLDRRLETFLNRGCNKQWIYYCCGQDTEVSNRFIAMPSYRNRVIGLQIYKYGITGFLQWGYNFYNSQLSLYPINPLLTSSAECSFPSGDPFSVYPSCDGPLPSLRALIFREALQDVEICRILEKYIGKKAVIEMIEQAAGQELTFFSYPKNKDFIPNLIFDMKKRISTIEENNVMNGIQSSIPISDK